MISFIVQTSEHGETLCIDTLHDTAMPQASRPITVAIAIAFIACVHAVPTPNDIVPEVPFAGADWPPVDQSESESARA